MCKIKYLSMIAAAVMRTRPPVCRCPGVVMLSVTSDDKMWCVCDTTSHNIAQHRTTSHNVTSGPISRWPLRLHTSESHGACHDQHPDQPPPPSASPAAGEWSLHNAHYTHHLPRAKAERGFRQSSTLEGKNWAQSLGYKDRN